MSQQYDTASRAKEKFQTKLAAPETSIISFEPDQSPSVALDGREA